MKFAVAWFLLGSSLSAWATPAPNDVWECMKKSDPAMMKDIDLSARPLLCHLLEYTVDEMEIGLNVQSSFECLFKDGTIQKLRSGAQCLAMPKEPQPGDGKF